MILPDDTLYKGPLERVRKTLMQKLNKENEQFEKELDEIEKSFGPLASGCKDSLLKEMANISVNSQSESDIQSHDPVSQSKVDIDILGKSQSAPSKKGLIEEVSSVEIKRTEPDYTLQIKEKDEDQGRRIIVKIKLPDVKSVADCELDISEVGIFSVSPIFFWGERIYQINILFVQEIVLSCLQEMFQRANMYMICNIISDMTTQRIIPVLLVPDISFLYQVFARPGILIRAPVGRDKR